MLTSKKTKYIDKEKVRMVIDYAKDIVEQVQSGHYEYPGSPSYAVFAYAVNLYGFGAFPQVVSDEEYEKLGTPEQFRGAHDPEFNANLLCDYDYHYGEGIEGYGIYSSSYKSIASAYAQKFFERQQKPENIMRFKLSEDIRLYGKKNIELYPKSFIEKIKNPDLSYIRHLISQIQPKELMVHVRNLLGNDVAIMAILLGYDGSNYQHIQTYNRGKIIVSESEFKRVCSLSRKYKDGTIDFQQKYENDEFLNE